MNCSQLFHLLLRLRKKLNIYERLKLYLIKALIDNNFPVEKWEKDGSLEGMVDWANKQYGNYCKYCYKSHREEHGIDEFIFYLAEWIMCHSHNRSLEDPTKADMEKVYDYCQNHPILGAH